MLTTTMAKKNLKYEAQKVVMCQMIGKLKIPNSPNSKVKNPKKFIFIDDKTKTVNGSIKLTNMRTLLVLLSQSFCNSSCMSRIIFSDWLYEFCENYIWFD
ncbi:hypothetical protein GCM10011444_14260 [Winogradskyella haliclonae]|uniref:Uncharacterized protein n=1 Tax=Winogradskyella haliclonae TaxID=2048558 RepID=A0ABQ2BZZ3_9FLAO|nr:hypothetical protein GCM10011444_14260 [Winogradskyella haliclonae]